MQVTINNELTVEVVPNEEHEWLLSTKDVAEGYGLSEGGLRKAKFSYKDELEEGKHYLTVADRNAQNFTGSSKARTVTMWTKRGVARLGFFIKTPMAKEFRDWAEDYIIEGQGNTKPTEYTIPFYIPQTFAEALTLAAEQARQLELQAPKVEVYDALMDPSVIPTKTLRDVGKDLGYEQTEFFAMLRRDNIIFQNSSRPKSPYDQKGYFKSTTEAKNGVVVTSWRVTPSGLEFLFRKYGKKAAA